MAFRAAVAPLLSDTMDHRDVFICQLYDAIYDLSRDMHPQDMADAFDRFRVLMSRISNEDESA